MSLRGTALHRAVNVDVQTIRDLEQHRRQLAYDQLQEIEHQFQIPIEGLATTNLNWSFFDLAFDVEFFFAPQQRDSPLVYPHFHFGSHVTGDTDDSAAPGTPDPNNPYGLVSVHANVIGWAEDVTREAIVGARIGYGVQCGGPTVTTTVDFHGFLHLTFQGFGHVGGADHGDNNPVLNVGT